MKGTPLIAESTPLKHCYGQLPEVEKRADLGQVLRTIENEHTYSNVQNKLHKQVSLDINLFNTITLY